MSPITTALHLSSVLIVSLCALLGSLFISGEALALNTCTILYADVNVTVEECRASPSETIITLQVSTENSQIKTAHAHFNLTARNLDQVTGAPLMWDRLWFTSPSSSLSTADQQALRDVLFRTDEDHLRRLRRLEFSGAKALIDVLANFVENDQSIPVFEAPNRRSSDFAFFDRLLNWTMICESRGLPRLAQFTSMGQARSHVAFVGVSDSACRGRCGAGCWQFGQWRDNQYTQECLNHDVCRDQLNSYFGECSDEFWSAAAGYMLAPSCLTY